MPGRPPVASGATPERILLLTFSRRAAREMLHAGRPARRGGRGAAGSGAARSTPSPTGCSRQHGAAVGLGRASPCSTRATPPTCSASSVTSSGSASKGRRFPKKDTLAVDLLARGQHPGAAGRRRRARASRGAATTSTSIEAVFAALHRAQAGPQRPRLRRPAALLAGAGRSRPTSGPLLRSSASTTCSSTSTRTPTPCRPTSSRRWPDPASCDHRGRRRRAGHLRVPVGVARAHARLPRSLRGRHGRHARPQLPLDAADPRRRQRGHRRGDGGFAKELRSTRPAGGRGPRSRPATTSWPRPTFVCDSVLEHRERGRRAARPGRAVPHRPPQRRARARAGPPQHPVREVRRAEVPRGGPRQGPPVPAAHPREPERRAGVAPRARPARRRRPGDGPPARRRARRGRGDRARAPARRRLPALPGAAAADDLDARCAPRWPTASGDRACRPRCRSSGSPRACVPIFDAPVPGRRVGPARRPRPAALAGQPTTRRRSRFLAELTLDPPATTGDLAGPPHLDDDFLMLSTIHSAKGGEWHVVHVIHASDGNIPSDMALGRAEEARGGAPAALRRA